ncbi:NeuD/PglB/VioB family sugar acetyltransferase [Rhizobium hidalgonense]|uniref:NeuD/PglB/VioB family sugar acetyltransferase n=1 Tax=Rhizobium hidalgonense TaxID=1538159 RepID=A0AAJ2GTU8_9HYPH|nr:NeuD/PglB/VioB family sugar acetyltransferase [Rhizobium hidalgonense]MDR9774801.1 NeuD/PglB/VioB family sugar acetyltransferase [Rhizobium hidalgonense]
MLKSQLVVLGGGGNALDALDTLQTSYEVVAFVDDDVTKQQRTIGGIPVTSRSALMKYPDAKVVSLIGSEKTFIRREEIIRSFNIHQSRFGRVIHPNANVSAYASIGRDVIIFAGVTIPSNARIGSHVFILPNTVIHHDSVIEDYTIIGASVVVAGNVNIGRSSFVGSGSSIKNNVEIGACSLIGMSANVTRSFKEESVLVGNPAKQLAR